MERPLKSISLILFLFVTGIWCNAQYTETINTNNPGRSQGAFAVGKNVAQIEGSLLYRSEEHDLQRYERQITGFSFQLRYGAITERLEFSYIGSFDRAAQTDFIGGVTSENSFSNFSSSTLGAKYLVLDPLLFLGEKEVNLLSWKANHRLNWRDLIPAVSVYAGANLNFSTNNPFTPVGDPSISPKFALITQNNWGRWVFVTNFIVDRVTTDFPSYEWILTMTHSLNRKWAIFGEYQGFKSDFYSDNLGRGGVAYLINTDWQVDLSGTLNFKDTPSLFQVNAGMSYRLDFHTDEEIKQTDQWEGGADEDKKDKEKNKLNTGGDDGRGL